MTITPEQRERRRGFLGASDSAAILGLDPYSTRADIYWSKKGHDAPFNDAFDYGNRFEPVILDWAEERLDCGPLKRDVEISDVECFGANLDGITEEGEVVEAKTCAIAGRSPEADQYGDDGTDEVPERVLIQVQHQMMVADATVAHVAALIGRVGFRLYRVERNDRVIEAIADAGRAFWEQHVMADSPPADEPTPMHVLKQLTRSPDEVAELDDDTLRAYVEAKADEKVAKDRVEELYQRVLESLGECEVGECAAGRATYKLTKKKGYTVGPTEYRQLRVRENKESEQ